MGGEPEGVFLYEGEVERMSINKSYRILPLISIALIFCLATPSHAMDVTLAWDANTESDLAGYKVYYDTNSGHPYTGGGAQEGSSPIDVPLNKDEDPNPAVFRHTIHNLPNGKYYFAVTAHNVGLLESGYSNEVSKESVSDTTPPVISNVRATAASDTAAVIEWTTDEPSNSQVQYGTSSSAWGNYSASKDDAAMVTSHSVTLTGLLGGTLYYFRVGSTDALGNGPSISNEAGFTTPASHAIENLSVGKTVTAGSSDWGTSVSSMVDGRWDDPVANWAADAVPNWVQVDLEGNYLISTINVGPYSNGGGNVWYYDGAWNIKYKSSTDAEWKDFTHVVKLSGAGTLVGPGISITNGNPGYNYSDNNYKYYSFKFDPVIAKYIRFEVTQGDKDGDANGSEIEIYGNPVSSNNFRPSGLRISR